MNSDCIFCKIVSGEAESSIIHDEDDVMAFLDMHPINPGHTLIIPKKHATNVYDIPKETLEKIATLSKDLSIKIKENLNADGISIFQMNEKAGDQDVMHYHLHVIPRYEGDWFHEEIMKAVKTQHKTNPIREELNSIAAKIRKI